jgi:FimV-like protein
MIELMKGHALFGTHQYSAAEEQYKRVLANYADRLEWSPRASGRAIVNPSNYGVSNSAAYSLANCTRILHALEPNRGADMYERFLQTYPNSEYAGTAAIDLAGIYTELGDTARAETILTSVIADAVDGAVRQRAEDLSSPAGWRDTEAVLARACGAALETRRASARKDSPMTKEKRPSRLAGKYSMHPPN